MKINSTALGLATIALLVSGLGLVARAQEPPAPTKFAPYEMNEVRFGQAITAAAAPNAARLSYKGAIWIEQTALDEVRQTLLNQEGAAQIEALKKADEEKKGGKK